MRSREFINESSGYSLPGSYTSDLVISKLWLADQLEKIMQKQGIDSVPVAYVLGSWYSNMSTVLRKMNLPIDLVVDVEKNHKWLQQAQAVQQAMNINGVKHMAADANKIDFRRLTDPGVVINTSINDMPDHGWFDHIPTGTIVALQGRDSVPSGAEHVYNSPDEILELYPLETVLYKGSQKLQDPETAYTRHMVIGIKGAEPLRELSFMGSQCTKDCSGHRAGYAWSRARGRTHAASWSDSFNKGAAIAASGQ
jgi:hypothetical protein